MIAPPIDGIHTLRLDDVHFGYEGSSKPVFEGMSIELPTDVNVLVTGEAGNGQSTLLKLLAVLVQPQSGSFFINGRDTTQMSFEEFLPYRRKIGYTFDYGGLFANRTLKDNLTLPLLYHKICSPEEAEAQAREFAREFRFEGQIDRRPAEVSGGLRKLVCVIRAFILRPEMMVMDDPFTGVDPENSKRLIALINDRRERGELKHVYFTSRDEVWPARLGYVPLIVEKNSFRIGSDTRTEKVA